MTRDLDFTFINWRGEYINYKDVVSGKYKIKKKFDEEACAKAGGIGWEYGAFCEDHLGKKGRTHASEYLECSRKILGTNEALDFFEKRYGPLSADSSIIEFGCNLGRNLRHAKERYGSRCAGIDINPHVIEENKKFFSQGDDFYVASLRDGGQFLKRFRDNEFDLGMTCGFLMHVAADENKKILINEMQRICKYLCFSEPNSAGLDLDSKKVVKAYNKGNGVTTLECMSNYISNIHEEKSAVHQPGEQGLYFYP